MSAGSQTLVAAASQRHLHRDTAKGNDGKRNGSAGVPASVALHHVVVELVELLSDVGGELGRVVDEDLSQAVAACSMLT